MIIGSGPGIHQDLKHAHESNAQLKTGENCVFVLYTWQVIRVVPAAHDLQIRESR